MMARVICMVCLRPVPRRWWQRGLLAPLRVHTWDQMRAGQCR